MSIRVAICCCNYLFGEGLKQLITGNGLPIDSTINCRDPDEVIDIRPNLLITDDTTFTKLSIDSLSKHGIKVALLETDCLPRLGDEQLFLCVSKGLIGILSSTSDVSQFRKAIKRIISGELWLDRKIQRDIIARINRKPKEIPSFTQRETEIIKMICKGFCNKEILQTLNISEQTVKIHLNHIYKKARVTDRLQLAVYAIKKWPNYINIT